MTNNLTPQDVLPAAPDDGDEYGGPLYEAIDPGANTLNQHEETAEDVYVVAETDPVEYTEDFITIEAVAVEENIATPVVVDDKTKTYKALKNKDYQDISAVLPTEHVTGEQLDLLHMEWSIKIEAIPNLESREMLKKRLDDLYRLAVNTADRNWVAFFNQDMEQYVTSVDPVGGSVPIRIGHPRIDIPDTVEMLSGKSATLVLNKQMRGGLVTKIPCWHSGLVVSSVPYPEKELVDYGINLSRTLMNLGADSLGATFSGDDIHIVGPAVELAISHIEDCQLKTFTPVTLRKTLLATDIPAILAGTLESIYPDGYPIHHICVNPKCNYVLMAERDARRGFKPNSLIDFSKVLKVHRPSLTQAQIRHMSQIARSTTVEAVKEYQNTLHDRLWGDNNKFVIWEEITNAGTESVSVVFKVPTLEEYMNTSNEWVQNITGMADAMLKTEPAWKTPAQVAKARLQYVNTYSAITDIVKNLCWVDRIVSTNANGISRYIVGADDIRKQLENFIQIDGVKESFDKSMQKFKEMSIIAWTGIPNFACPLCGCGQTDPNSKVPSLIPLNMVGYFFSTMVSRLQKMQ